LGQEQFLRRVQDTVGQRGGGMPCRTASIASAGAFTLFLFSRVNDTGWCQ
jgi:hypothetical protein